MSFCVPVSPPLQRWGSDWVCSFPQLPDWHLNFGSLPLFAGLLLFTHVVMTLAESLQRYFLEIFLRLSAIFEAWLFALLLSSFFHCCQTLPVTVSVLCLHACVFLIRFNPTTACVFLRALRVDKHTVKPRLS